MSLIALPPDYLSLNRRLPFGIYDSAGNLLVAPGCRIEDQGKLESLRHRPLFADDIEAGEHARHFQRGAQELVHKNATIEMIAGARFEGTNPNALVKHSRGLARGRLAGSTPITPGSRQFVPNRDAPLPQRVDQFISALSLALRDATGADSADNGWYERLESIRTAFSELIEQHPDAVLYLLMQHVTHKAENYTATQALLCTVMVDMIARKLDWPAEPRTALHRAALSMDVSIATMQDSLKAFDSTPRTNQSAQIKTHAVASADLLKAAGVSDALSMFLVRQHHSQPALQARLDAPEMAHRCLGLLATVEAYAAALHKVGDRAPITPMAALRATGLTPQGQLRDAATVIVKTLGMYPPGSYVRLQSGELGVAFGIGPRMNTPLVAVFLGPSGLALSNPVLRDTAQAGRAVAEAVPADQIRVQVPHEHVLALR